MKKNELIQLRSFIVCVLGLVSFCVLLVYEERIRIIEGLSAVYLSIMSASLLTQIYLIIGVISISAFLVFALYPDDDEK